MRWEYKKGVRFGWSGVLGISVFGVIRVGGFFMLFAFPCIWFRSGKATLFLLE